MPDDRVLAEREAIAQYDPRRDVDALCEAVRIVNEARAKVRALCAGVFSGESERELRSLDALMGDALGDTVRPLLADMGVQP